MLTHQSLSNVSREIDARATCPFIRVNSRTKGRQAFAELPSGEQKGVGQSHLLQDTAVRAREHGQERGNPHTVYAENTAASTHYNIRMIGDCWRALSV